MGSSDGVETHTFSWFNPNFKLEGPWRSPFFHHQGLVHADCAPKIVAFGHIWVVSRFGISKCHHHFPGETGNSFSINFWEPPIMHRFATRCDKTTPIHCCWNLYFWCFPILVGEIPMIDCKALWCSIITTTDRLRHQFRWWLHGFPMIVSQPSIFPPSLLFWNHFVH